ncbi:MAG: sigma-70 family RNA polymerase sigma factor, partial [Oscillospiraceae bacterium]|nr:sigma-70 family RNA polymerase sigma factor [Oscillospiraceae bacterium]
MVYAFLNANRLAENDFYDVIIFGFLQAVKNYSEKPGLALKYAFSTIAWNSMRTSLSDYYQKQSRLKRQAVIIEFETVADDENGDLLLDEVLAVPDSYTMDFETGLLMAELASKLSQREMEIIRMKIDGYGIR